MAQMMEAVRASEKLDHTDSAASQKTQAYPKGKVGFHWADRTKYYNNPHAIECTLSHTKFN
jgi:hypothetical protein